MNTGTVFNIQRFSIHDGPGIRTLVFLKGCPMRCLWCSNPESQDPRPDLFFTKVKCIGCGSCIEACPTGAVRSLHTEKGRIDKNLCERCGSCAAACCAHALAWKGAEMTVDEIIRTVEKDTAYYKNSGGGITLGGGEPSFQSDFAASILRTCRDRDIHTAVETCGYAEWDELKKLAVHTDFFLYDIKTMDPDTHRSFTGRDNALILENARRIADMGITMLIRVPVIWGYNDSEENILRTAEFARSLPTTPEIELLPYHRAGESKYTALGRDYALKGLKADNEKRIEHLNTLISQNDLEEKL